MRYFLILIIALINVNVFAQDKWFSNTGYIIFISETPLLNIEGENAKTVTFLKPSTGEIAFAMRMTDFTFELPLAREHFNENYIESDKYPNASFKGKITNNETVNYNANGTYPVFVSGEITIHGVTQTINEKAILTIEGQDKISGFSTFILKPEDFKIKVPKLVRDKVAETIPVTVKVDYKPYSDGK